LLFSFDLRPIGARVIGMNQKLAKLHLYLGAFFAPLIVLFAFSGVLQIFNFHKKPKDGDYVPPEWLYEISNIHMHQQLRIWQAAMSETSVQLIKYLSAAMGVGLVLMAFIGVILAFQRTPRRKFYLPLLALALGIVLPVLLMI